MKVLVIGGGGREHALCLALSADPGVTELHCAPGNAGIAELATLHPVTATDPTAVADLADALDAAGERLMAAVLIRRINQSMDQPIRSFTRTFSSRPGPTPMTLTRAPESSSSRRT